MTDQPQESGVAGRMPRRFEETLIGGVDGQVTGAIVRRVPATGDITPRTPQPGDRVQVSSQLSMIGTVLEVADGRALVEAPAGWRASYPLDRLTVAGDPPDSASVKAPTPELGLQGTLEALAYYDSHGRGDITGPRLPRSRPPLPPGLELLLRQVAMPDPAEDRAALARTAAWLLAALGVTCAAGHIGPIVPGLQGSGRCLSCGEVSGK